MFIVLERLNCLLLLIINEKLDNIICCIREKDGKSGSELYWLVERENVINKILITHVCDSSGEDIRQLIW